jgi:hypothetical protein
MEKTKWYEYTTNNYKDALEDAKTLLANCNLQEKFFFQKISLIEKWGDIVYEGRLTRMYEPFKDFGQIIYPINDLSDEVYSFYPSDGETKLDKCYGAGRGSLVNEYVLSFKNDKDKKFIIKKEIQKKAWRNEEVELIESLKGFVKVIDFRCFRISQGKNNPETIQIIYLTNRGVCHIDNKKFVWVYKI